MPNANHFKYKYLEKNLEESSLILYKNVKLTNYINTVFGLYGILVHDCRISYNLTTTNIIIYFFNSNINRVLLKESKKKLVSTIITDTLSLSLTKYFKTKKLNIKTKNFNKTLENTQNNAIINKIIKKNFKKFFKDPYYKDLIKIILITVVEKSSAKTISDFLSIYIDRHKKKHNYLVFVLKKVFTVLINSKISKIKGLKVSISGRINGSTRTRVKKFKVGFIPLQSFKYTIDYHNSTSYTSHGSFGIKVWICKSYILKMFLQPKKTKYKKIRKGTLPSLNFKSNNLKFGTIGLKSLESGYVSSKQLESARKSIMNKTNRKGKLWIRLFPCSPITKKPIESRMGKGKGSINFWSSKVSGGSLIFELCGVNKSTAISAFKSGGSKLPLKTSIFT